MAQPSGAGVEFVRLTEVSLNEIASHMSDPRVGEHMPLLEGVWDAQRAREFVTAKEQYWARDGLGHWGILWNGAYAGWGGFQNEDGDWDFGLVLLPEHFGLGLRVTKKALEFAVADPRIDAVTFLLPPSRKHLGGLHRLGAQFVGEIDYEGKKFLKYRLET